MAKLSMSLSAETTEREYKREVEFKKPKSWLKTVSAFCNGIGGTIYFGVNDDKEIVGIENIQSDIEKISELIKTRIEPLANFKITVINQDNKDIIKLEIIQGTKTPYYYVGDGNKIVYVRIGNESVNAPIYDREYSGNLIMLLENGFNFIKNHNRKAWKKLPRTRVEYNDYNERAITEILVNALIHRMYDIMGAEIHIDIYDDRLEIWSPGGMYDGSSIQNESILEIPSKRRNPVIADVFQRLGYMERRGSGLKKIYEAIDDKEKFKFYSDRSGFKVTLVNENYNREIEKNADKPLINRRQTGDKFKRKNYKIFRN